MGRFYRLSKKISEQEASEITREILELPDIQNAEIVDGKVRVETKDNVFVDVMSQKKPKEENRHGKHETE